MAPPTLVVGVRVIGASSVDGQPGINGSGEREGGASGEEEERMMFFPESKYALKK